MKIQINVENKKWNRTLVTMKCESYKGLVFY